MGSIDFSIFFSVKMDFPFPIHFLEMQLRVNGKGVENFCFYFVGKTERERIRFNGGQPRVFK